MNIVDRMEALADEWHNGVERKGKGHIPYIEHPRAIVELLKTWGMTEIDNPVPLAAAWGHDLIEDTKVPAISIMNASCEYGMEVMSAIMMLTFVRSAYPREMKHEEADLLYMKRIAERADPEVLMVKLADRICNTRDYIRNPHTNDKTKPARYLHEAYLVLEAAETRVPEKYRKVVLETIEELKREANYYEWCREHVD